MHDYEKYNLYSKEIFLLEIHVYKDIDNSKFEK